MSIVLDIAILAACLALNIAVHEAGHLAAALAVGIPVSSMNVGGGPLVAEKQFGGVWVRFRLFPVCGVVIMCWQSRKTWKNVTVVVAGPVANMVLGIALLLVPWHMPRLFAVAMFVAALSLVPWLEDSDGSMLVELWRRGR